MHTYTYLLRHSGVDYGHWTRTCIMFRSWRCIAYSCCKVPHCTRVHVMIPTTTTTKTATLTHLFMCLFVFPKWVFAAHCFGCYKLYWHKHCSQRVRWLHRTSMFQRALLYWTHVTGIDPHLLRIRPLVCCLFCQILVTTSQQPSESLQ